ncbi:MAG TPA: hypothetical protein VFK21_00790 [Gammaproteobacteria bacterium]|nr:hypothetical protein [Gammaproteobacteria bacterium]
MFELASTPRDLGEILVQGLRLGRLAFRRLFMLTSLLAFLALIPTVSLVWGAGDVTIAMGSIDELLQRFRGPYGIAAVLIMVIGLPFQALLLSRIAAASRGQTESLQVEWRTALRAWPWMFVAMIVYALAVILGMVLLIVPGLILAISLMFAQFSVVLDSRGPIQALNRSHNLVWGHWWRTFGLLLLMVVPLWLVVAIASGLMGIDTGSSADMTVTGRGLFEQGVVQMVFYALCSPFVYSVLYVYYHDLKLRKQDG